MPFVQAARYGNNVSDASIVRNGPAGPTLPSADTSQRMLKRVEHERQRAIQRKLFEDQMRALEQQQAQELLSIEGAGLQHLAASAPTTPPRVNAMLSSNEYSPHLQSGLSQSSMDADTLSKAVGSAVDKRKSVTYAPSVAHSPESHTSNHQSFARPGGAKSMPASRRTSASEHDEELAGHLDKLSLAGERASPVPGSVQQSILRSSSGRFGAAEGMGYAYNAGMMLDEQIDQEMHSTSVSSLIAFYLMFPFRRYAQLTYVR